MRITTNRNQHGLIARIAQMTDEEYTDFTKLISNVVKTGDPNFPLMEFTDAQRDVANEIRKELPKAGDIE